MTKKTCTKCLDYKPISEFYLKRNKPESVCKECKKSARRTKYVGAKSEKIFSLLTNVTDELVNIEFHRLENLHSLVATIEIAKKIRRRS